LTDHELAEATVVFDLADADRSQLGAVTVTETNLAPSTVRAFKLPIDEANATFAVVREVHTR
jgi:predicted component of type VI protein secretion system